MTNTINQELAEQTAKKLFNTDLNELSLNQIDEVAADMFHRTKEFAEWLNIPMTNIVFTARSVENIIYV